MYGRSAEILPFLLEEVGYYFTGLYGTDALDLSPVFRVGRRVSQKIRTMLEDPLIPSDVRAGLQSAYDEQMLRHGYMVKG